MTLIINKKTYETGELIAYVEKLEKENARLKADYGVLSCSVGDFAELQNELDEEQRKNNGLSDNLTEARKIIYDLINLTEPTSTEETQHWNEIFKKAEAFINKE